jgi:hypothetical protein
VAWLLPTLSAVALLACNQNKLDQDGDGFTELTGDCDDLDANVHPEAPEVCYNGIDDNCNGVEDEEGATSGRVWYQDYDGDGYGKEELTVLACDQPEGYAAEKWDCQEDNAAIHPGAVEVCDSVDNNCNGRIDEVASTDAPTWYPDRDGDGYGDDAGEVRACEAPPGHIAEGGDCGDLDPLQSPDATEDCRTEADDDCDGSANGEDAYGCQQYYGDSDGDGFAGTAACLCAPTAEYSATESEDCDDTRADVYPGAPVSSRFAVEDCTADSTVDLTTADHTLQLGARTDQKTGLLLDATGDGIDDLLVGDWDGSKGATLLEGPVSAHSDLSGGIATLPIDPGYYGQLWQRVLPDQDGDGLEDVLQVRLGDGETTPAVYAFSSADRGELSLDDALWSVELPWPLMQLQVLPASGSAPAELLFAETGSPNFALVQLPGGGAEPVFVGEVEDPLFSGFQVVPTLRADFTGDGINELVVQQVVRGFVDELHTWDGGPGVYGPNAAVAILEPYAEDDPLDLLPLHVVYGPSNLGYYGSIVARDMDGDGYPDLIASEYGSLLEADSGAIYGFTADSMLHRSRPYSVLPEADAIYSGAAGDGIHLLQETADLDGDGDAAILARGMGETTWLIDQLPMGHHPLREMARPMAAHMYLLATGDGNGDGIDDLMLTQSDSEDMLRFYWGETQ